MTALDVLNSVSGQLYYPIEHIAWAADKRLVSLDSTSIWTWAIYLWAISLLVGLLQAIRTILRTSRELSELNRSTGGQSSGDASNSSGASTESSSLGQKKRVTFQDQRSAGKARLRVLRKQRFLSLLSMIKNLSDLMNAVHWLPERILWAGRLSNFWSGLFGTVSSLIGLYKLVPASAQK